MKALAAAVSEGPVREAPGLVEPAFYLDIPGAGTQLHVPSGERLYLMASILGFGKAGEVSAAAKMLARKALGRME